MNSPHQREQLPDLLSDALEPTERARVESHLAGCEQCARELRALQRMQQTLVALPAATPPDRVRANVRAALRADKKQGWALAALQGNRVKNSARKALPFALPARQLAWGGAVALGAVGLMLLARPSLQTSSPGQLAPASETELAARATTKPGTANDAATRSAAKTPGTKAPTAKTKSNVKPKPTTSLPALGSGVSDLPGVQADLPPLPILPPPPQQPLARLAKPESLAPIPKTETPTPELSPGSAPELSPGSAPIPAHQAGAGQPKNRPDASASTTKPAVPAQPAPAPPLGRSAMTKQTPKSNEQNDLDSTQSPTNSEMDRARASADANGDANDASAKVQSKTAGNAPAAFAPPPMASSPAPAVPAPAVSAPAISRKMAVSDGWAGGAVSANVKRGGNAAPVLTLSVGIAIGDARLFLLLPSGETQVWRGSMNAAPIDIKLPVFAGKVRSGQKIRARLEQINGEGNPKGSTTFTLVWP